MLEICRVDLVWDLRVATDPHPFGISGTGVRSSSFPLLTRLEVQSLATRGHNEYFPQRKTRPGGSPPEAGLTNITQLPVWESDSHAASHAMNTSTLTSTGAGRVTAGKSIYLKHREPPRP